VLLLIIDKFVVNYSGGGYVIPPSSNSLLFKKACGREKEKRRTRSNERSTLNRRTEKIARKVQNKMRFNSGK